MKIKKEYNLLKNIITVLLLLQLPTMIFAQENEKTNFNRDSLITAAKKMMQTARYCALITLDKTGNPVARTMDPFLPEDDMIVWFGTNINSRKIKEIKNDSRVTIYYQAPNQVGYTLIKGKAFILDDTLKKQTYWKEEWSRFYPGNKSNYILIKVIPDKLEIIDYQKGITGDSTTWAVPFVMFNSEKSN